MKKIILVRHAKSSWLHDVIDHQRPLKARGVKDADIVSKFLNIKKPIIDVVFSSDALRAKTTAEIFISNLNIDKNLVKLNHDLYDFSGEDLIRVIKTCNCNITTLMIFGHNYALTAFVNHFGDEYIDNVPTSGVVIIEFDIEDWSLLKQGKTLQTLFPRDLKS